MTKPCPCGDAPQANDFLCLLCRLFNPDATCPDALFVVTIDQASEMLHAAIYGLPQPKAQ